uniref:Uncharacterized protein n=1 Tax=Monopterus albus TaxID=43700 RepID=A0A3Q3K6C6_MONAL
MSGNWDLKDPGVKQLCAGLESPHCRLETLTSVPVSALGHFISTESNPSHLRHLDLSGNDQQDPDFCAEMNLMSFMGNCFLLLTVTNPLCNLSDNNKYTTSCASLASALKSNPSHLRELNLCYNILQDPDVKQLCDLVQSPDYRLETLSLDMCFGSAACSTCPAVCTAGIKANSGTMSPVVLEHGFASYIVPHVLFHVADVFSRSLQCRNSEKQAANEKMCPNFGPVHVCPVKAQINRICSSWNI